MPNYSEQLSEGAQATGCNWGGLSSSLRKTFSLGGYYGTGIGILSFLGGLLAWARKSKGWARAVLVIVLLWVGCQTRQSQEIHSKQHFYACLKTTDFFPIPFPDIKMLCFYISVLAFKNFQKFYLNKLKILNNNYFIELISQMWNLLFTEQKPHKNIIYICQNQNMSEFLNENILVCIYKPTGVFSFACHESESRIII